MPACFVARCAAASERSAIHCRKQWNATSRAFVSENLLTSSLAGLRHGSSQSRDRKSTRLNSSHPSISYAVFCLKKKKKHINITPLHSPSLHSPLAPPSPPACLRSLVTPRLSHPRVPFYQSLY